MCQRNGGVLVSILVIGDFSELKEIKVTRELLNNVPTSFNLFYFLFSFPISVVLISSLKRYAYFNLKELSTFIIFNANTLFRWFGR
jgi:hypothetical protein